MGKQERMYYQSFLFSTFSEITTTIEEELAEGGNVACRITKQCTLTGNYQGIPATGKRISMTCTEIFSR